MELKSEQQYTDVAVTDFDIAFPDDLQTYTLKDGLDTLKADGEWVTITFAAGGSVAFNTRLAHWYAKRQRTLRVPVPQTGE